MKTNKYFVKFTLKNVPNISEEEIFYTFVSITQIDNNADPKTIFCNICEGCNNDLKELKGLTVSMDKINIHVLSLLDSINTMKENA